MLNEVLDLRRSITLTERSISQWRTPNSKQRPVCVTGHCERPCTSLPETSRASERRRTRRSPQSDTSQRVRLDAPSVSARDIVPQTAMSRLSRPGAPCMPRHFALSPTKSCATRSGQRFGSGDMSRLLRYVHGARSASPTGPFPVLPKDGPSNSARPHRKCRPVACLDPGGGITAEVGVADVCSVAGRSTAERSTETKADERRDAATTANRTTTRLFCHDSYN